MLAVPAGPEPTFGAPDEKIAGGAAAAAAVREVTGGVRASRVGDCRGFDNRRGDRTVIVGSTLGFSAGRAASASAGPALVGVWAVATHGSKGKASTPDATTLNHFDTAPPRRLRLGRVGTVSQTRTP